MRPRSGSNAMTCQVLPSSEPPSKSPRGLGSLLRCGARRGCSPGASRSTRESISGSAANSAGPCIKARSMLSRGLGVPKQWRIRRKRKRGSDIVVKCSRTRIPRGADSDPAGARDGRGPSRLACRSARRHRRRTGRAGPLAAGWAGASPARPASPPWARGGTVPPRAGLLELDCFRSRRAAARRRAERRRAADGTGVPSTPGQLG